MDLITFIQASTIKAPTHTTQQNPLKSEGKEFANLLEQVSQSDLGENFLDTSEFENLSLEDMETLILNILDELNIDVDDMTEVDFNVIAQFLLEIRGKNLNKNSISLNETDTDVGLTEPKAFKNDRKEGSLAFKNDQIDVSLEVEKPIIDGKILEGSSAESAQKESFLKELIQLMDKNVDKETLKDFLSKHIPELKEISKLTEALDLDTFQNPLNESTDELSKKVKQTEVNLEQTKEPLNVSDKVEQTDTHNIIDEAVMVENKKPVSDDVVKASIVQSAVYNENRIRKVTETATVDNNQIADLNSENNGLSNTLVKPELNQNFSDQKQPQMQSQTENNQSNVFKSDEIKPMYSEGGFQPEANTEGSSGDVKVQFGQVSIDTTLPTKPVEAIVKTEAVRYTTPVEFVDQLNGIITKHSKGIDGVEKISIQIYPKELGKIDLDLNMHHQKLSIDFTVSNDRVKEIIETNFVGLVDQLDTKGVQVDKLEAKTEKQHQQQKFDDQQQKQRQKQNGDNQQEHQQQKRKLGYNTFELTA